ncbi:MAG: MBL fold metallo-hydrolase [Clostridia bacterium]|nr:MBL fold metallo-hydrolase [Clostridia bacterium]
MKLTFIGASHEVTGSCTLLNACGKNILIDCGMEQGADIYENADLPILPMDIDAILLTHAHIDHSGKIPAMVASGYTGPIYSTEATHSLCKIMLKDSAHIQEFEAKWRNRKARRSGEESYSPIYTMADAEKSLSLFESYPYNEDIEIFGGISISFLDAGHLLGSSSIYIKINEHGKETTLLFSGDLGNVDRPLIRNPEKPTRADYVVIESTYGDRSHGERPDYVSQFTEIIQKTLDRGGNVVIPSFAIGRTQEILYLIRKLKDDGLAKNHGDFPVYVDSPLAIEATEIYSSGLYGYYDEETLALLENGIDPIKFKGLKTAITSEESRAINESNSPCVIISASGMCEAGRIRHHLKHNLWRSESTILFVGYQSEGTLGRAIIDGEKFVSLFGEDIAVRAEIATIDGISGHADRGMLLDWLGALEVPPRCVFVNHGNDAVCDTFASLIQDSLGYKAIAPFSGDAFDLYSGECVEKGVITRVTPKIVNAKKRSSAIFERLMSAGKRLLSVIEQNRGGANKDLARFTSQIEALCDKYEMPDYSKKKK